MWEGVSVNINSEVLSEDAATLVIIFLFLISGLLIIALCYFIAKALIALIVKIFRLDMGKSGIANTLYKTHVIQRFSYLIPALLLFLFNGIFDISIGKYKFYMAGVMRLAASVYMAFSIAMILSAIINLFYDRYSRLPISKLKPIKSYLQVVKLLIYTAAIIASIAIISQRSPFYFLTGMGALTAIIVVVFKDSILGFVASVQLALYDMVHIGDTIEMPSFGADGEVIDISLNTVKVQNADKSIVTIPSYALLTSGMKNWRGMKEAGGRRIKRAIHIDITSIKICDQKLLNNLKQIPLLKEVIPQEPLELKSFTAIDLSNIRHTTNLGLFCEYLENYLHKLPGLRKDMRIIVRQLEATPTGLPLQLYAYAKETNTQQFEMIQASIMEHIYAMLPIFELRLFQYPSDHVTNGKLTQVKLKNDDELV